MAQAVHLTCLPNQKWQLSDLSCCRQHTLRSLACHKNKSQTATTVHLRDLCARVLSQLSPQRKLNGGFAAVPQRHAAFGGLSAILAG